MSQPGRLLRAGGCQVSWADMTEQAVCWAVLRPIQHACCFRTCSCYCRAHVQRRVFVDRASCGTALEWYETGWNMSSFEGLPQRDSQFSVTPYEKPEPRCQTVSSDKHRAVWKISTVPKKDTLKTILSLEMIHSKMWFEYSSFCFECHDHPKCNTVVFNEQYCVFQHWKIGNLEKNHANI